MSRIDCFTKHAPELEKQFKKMVDDGMPEMEAAKKLVDEKALAVSKELNDFKKSLDPTGKKIKRSDYTPTDVSKEVEAKKAEYQKQIDEIKNAQLDAIRDDKQKEQIKDLIKRAPNVDADKIAQSIAKMAKMPVEEVAKIIEEVRGAEPPKPPVVEDKKAEPEYEIGKRRFSGQVLSDESIIPEVRTLVEKNSEYIKQKNQLSVDEAGKIIDEVGAEQAYYMVTGNANLKPAVRVVMGEVLIRKFNDLAAKETDKAKRDYYINRTADTADYVAEQLGTIPGQIIQALSLFSRLTPEAQLLSAVKNAKEEGAAKVKKVKKLVDKVSEKLQDANAESAEEVISSKKVQSLSEEAKIDKIKVSKEKIQKIRENRAEIIKKYKANKGDRPLFSSVLGLTPEGIEFVGDVAVTYIKEGIVNAEILAEKIIQHLKEVGGKDPSDEVIKNAKSIISEKIDIEANKDVIKNLPDFEQKIGKSIREFYTVPTVIGESLKQKLINEVGLDGKLAESFANEVHSEFEKIATRKKNEILFKEKSTFDKIQNKLGGANKKQKNTLHEDVIKYSNLGAFENDAFTEFLVDKLGVGKLTPEEGVMITKLAEKVQRAPEGSPKNDATQDLLAYRANLKGSSWAETIQGVWYANILSGYKTHIKNVVSTFFNGMSFFGAEAARNPSAIPALLFGAARGAKRGVTEAYHTIKTGRSPIHVSKIEIPGILERKRFIGGLLNPYNWLKFVGRTMVAEDVLQFQSLKEMKATQTAYMEAAKMGYKNPFSKATWKVVNEKLLNTPERSAEAIAQAESEGLKKGTSDWKRRVYEIMELSRPIKMTENAYGFAAKGTFNHDTEGSLGAITNAISSIIDIPVGKSRPLRFVVPFTRILTNVVNNALDFSPVGFIRAARGVRGFESFEKFSPTKGTYKEMTKEERSQTIAKASLGIAVTAGLYALTQMKDDDDKPILEITGSGTGDYSKDEQLRQSGWQPYSIKIGDTYVSYALTPLVFNLGFVGSMNDHKKYSKNATDESLAKRVALAAFQTSGSITDMTWIASSSKFMEAFSQENRNSPDKGVKSLLKNLENTARQTILPNAYTQAAQKIQQIFDMPQKQANNAYERLIQDIPIARNLLNDKINALGDPIVRDTDIMISSETTDPVWRFLFDNNLWVSPVDKNTIIVKGVDGEERPITDDEYYDFSKQRGQRIKDKIKKLIDSGVSEKEIENKLEKIKTNATKDIKYKMFADN